MSLRKKMLCAACALVTVFGVSVSAMAEDVTESSTQVQESEIGEGTLNLLLVGSDRRNDGWYGNSDTMILLTINDELEQISMVSFMRDLAADIPGYGTQKLNAANAVGGPELLMETLKQNFGVKIDHYAAVDFQNVVNIIDAMGGVDIEQSAEEVEVTNGYIRSLCEDWDLDADEYYVTEADTHLNGLQALAYMRDRYVGNDYERTARQRKVLETLLGGVDISDMGEMTSLATAIFKNVDTDLGLFSALSLVKKLGSVAEYSLVTDRIPYDDLHSSSNEMLIPVQPDTNERLLTTIYGE